MNQQINLESLRKGLHSTDDHQKPVTLAADIPQCLKNCCSFHHKANDPSTLLPAELEHCQITNHFPSPPWQLSTHRKE